MSTETKNKLVPRLRFPEFQNAGEWEVKQIGDILNVESSSLAFNKLELKKSGYAVYGADSIVGYIDTYQHSEQYISIVKDGSGVGRLNLCKPETSILGTLCALKSKDENKYLTVWVYYLLNTIDFSGYVKGAGIPHIYYSDYKHHTIGVANPAEQKKIASCLSSLDEVITGEQQKLELLKQHKKGLLQNLFPQEGERVPKLRFPEFVQSAGWNNIKIGDIAQVSTGGTPESTNPEYWGGEIPWMNSGELNQKRIYSVSNYITKKGYDESSTKLIPPNCVLIGLAGQGKTRGTVAINYIELCTNQSIGAIHPNVEVFESEFLFQMLDSLYEKIRKLSAGDGGRGGLNLQIIKAIEIFLPSLKEQQKIAACLSSLDDLINAQRQKIELLKQHKKGLLQNLFPQAISNYELRIKN